jgi:hypothetical protein
MSRLLRLSLLALVALVLVLPQGAAAQEPTWYSLPYILGPNPPKVGDELSGENGGLYCSPVCTSQVYQWFHCTANTNYSNCVPASPLQDSKYYKVQESDVGWSLVVQVVARNHDCNEKNTECRDVTKTKNSLPTAPVQGTAAAATPAAPTTPGAPATPTTPAAPAPPPPLEVQPGVLFPTTPAIFYSQTLSVTGGVEPYKFSFDSGLLPAGITFTSDGVLSGISDSAAGLFPFTVTATDKTGRKVTKELNLIVAAPVIVATPLGLSHAVAGSPYSVTLGAVGGIVPHSFTLVDGDLPPGMGLSMGGRLAGVPTVAGTSHFTVGMLDSRGSTGTQTFRFVVERAQQTVVKKKPAAKTPAKKKKKKTTKR